MRKLLIFYSIIFGLMISEMQQSVSSDCLSAFKTAMLQRHNELRAKSNVSSMIANSTLDGSAQTWADIIAASGYFAHSRKPGVGENLAMIYQSNIVSNSTECSVLARDMTNMWYNEISAYNFSNPSFTFATGHFTQVVWKNSLQLGVGLGNSTPNAFYAVAQYYQPGNVFGLFRSNVFPPIF